jgi:hypothetical protein
MSKYIKVVKGTKNNMVEVEMLDYYTRHGWTVEDQEEDSKPKSKKKTAQPKPAVEEVVETILEEEVGNVNQGEIE